MAEVLTQSIILMLFVILGYFMKRVKIFGNTDYRVMTRTVMYVTLPCTIINGFSRFEWDNSLLLIPFLGLGVNIVLQAVGYLMCRKRDDQDKIYYMLNTPSFSTGTFAMPFIQNSLGVEGIVAACIFDVGGTLMPSGLSYVCASAVLKEQKERVNAAFVVKKLFTSPGICGKSGDDPYEGFRAYIAGLRRFLHIQGGKCQYIHLYVYDRNDVRT